MLKVLAISPNPVTTATITTLPVYSEAGIVAVLGFGLPFIFLLCTGPVSKFYAKKDSNQTFSTILTVLLPVIVSIIATYSDLFKLATWISPGENILWPIGSSFVLLGCVVVLKVYENAAKSVLSGDLKALKSHREAAVYTSQLFTAIVEQKLNRIYAARTQNNGLLPREQFIEVLNPTEQLSILFKAARTHLARTLPAGYRLRIGIYRKSEDGKWLERIAGWDGTSDSCYSGRCREHMRLDRPNPISELVKAYFGRENLVIHQSCYASMKKGNYTELLHEHRKLLKSMMVYRHELPVEHSTQGAILLEVNTNHDNFFLESDFDTHEAFFVALMRRLEYEYVAADVTEAAGTVPSLGSGTVPALDLARPAPIRPARKSRTNKK